MSQTPITLADYDPDWPAAFDAEASHIESVIGEHIERIEHIGSTAVPGLPAKPIIDIMVGLDALADAARCLGPLEALGYEYVSTFEDVMPERRYLRKSEGDTRTHHLHMVETASDFWERHLAFRDYLRTHPEVAADYADLKRDLAAAHPHDIGAYTDGKDDFIRRVERQALTDQ
ncbi:MULTISPECIES: GrpB family protein [unclassified Haladaptatus]|uniref:GrpB family protein n=1 Tax=unclassified Haladaptatus TaxID=2622732 RepID=UPI0023E7B3E8|nr:MULTISPECIES: GrpB family protein [unclassified Haladaptatus]